MRVIKTIAIVAGLYIAATIIEIATAWASPDYESGGGVGLVVILAILGLMATKVGYRWHDCLFAFIPFYGIFFIFRIAHRVAYLPNRDWVSRDA